MAKLFGPTSVEGSFRLSVSVGHPITLLMEREMLKTSSICKHISLLGL